MANKQIQGSSTAAPVAPGKETLDDEERLEDALEQLKELHLQLRRLRSTVPRMLSPLYGKHPSPEAYKLAFNQSVADARKEVQDFHDVIMSEDSRKVFQQASASRRAKPAGIKPWRYSDDPEWTTTKRVKREETAPK